MELGVKHPQQGRRAVGIGLQSIRDEIGLLLVGVTAELRTPVKIQLPDHLQGHQIALQNADFGVKIALFINIVGVGR